MSGVSFISYTLNDPKIDFIRKKVIFSNLIS